MEYWVYENWTVKKARIHEGPCPYCNNGQGTDKPKPRGAANGEWHGPYASVDRAAVVADRTGQPVSRCRRCKP